VVTQKPVLKGQKNLTKPVTRAKKLEIFLEKEREEFIRFASTDIKSKKEKLLDDFLETFAVEIPNQSRYERIKTNINSLSISDRLIQSKYLVTFDYLNLQLQLEKLFNTGLLDEVKSLHSKCSELFAEFEGINYNISRLNKPEKDWCERAMSSSDILNESLMKKQVLQRGRRFFQF
jgi:hypothetical protein